MEEAPLENDFLSFCGRCGGQFQGGPGNPFCSKCLSELRAENGHVEDGQKPFVPENPNGSQGNFL